MYRCRAATTQCSSELALRHSRAMLPCRTIHASVHAHLLQCESVVAATHRAPTGPLSALYRGQQLHAWLASMCVTLIAFGLPLPCNLA